MMWYVLAASLLFLPFQPRSALVLLAVSLGLGIFNHTLMPLAMAPLAVIGIVAIYCGIYQKRTPWALHGELVLVVSAIALLSHLIPGFNNQIIVSGVRAGPESAPFTFWYNFDKALVPFILLACMPTLLKATPQPPKNPLWWPVLVLSPPILLLVATLAGGLKIEPHLPPWLGEFALANLFFVSLAEEALFRGYIQQRLSGLIGERRSLLIAAVIFGLAHLGGGLLLVIFATLAGVIYGLAWRWSGRLWVAALMHFWFNLLHLLFFTYPFWQHPGS